MKRADFIDLPLRPSRRLAWLLATFHGAAIIAVVVLPVPGWLRAAACALLMLNATAQVARHASRLGDRACVGLHLLRDGSCQLRLAGGRTMAGQLCRGWFVAPQLIVMRISCAGERLSRGLCLLPDSADQDDLRRLRVFLRFAIDPRGRS